MSFKHVINVTFKYCTICRAWSGHTVKAKDAFVKRHQHRLKPIRLTHTDIDFSTFDGYFMMEDKEAKRE